MLLQRLPLLPLLLYQLSPPPHMQLRAVSSYRASQDDSAKYAPQVR